MRTPPPAAAGGTDAKGVKGQPADAGGQPPAGGASMMADLLETTLWSRRVADGVGRRVWGRGAVYRR